MTNRYVGPGIQERGTALPESFEQFESEALAAGCDQALVREWQPNTLLETHMHPFDAEAVVVRGEMWLSEGERTWHLTPGATFRLPAGTPHSERYGPQGATYWVGRRPVPA